MVEPTVEVTGFGEFAEDLRDMAERFEDQISATGGGFRDPKVGHFQNYRQAIQAGVERGMDRHVMPEAKANVPTGDADDHHWATKNANDLEGERAPVGHMRDSLYHQSRGWQGDSYTHEYGSDSPYEYVAVQEYGTHKHEYDITPNGDYPLTFDWDKAGGTVHFEFVQHPGIEPKTRHEGPIRSALYNNRQSIVREIDNTLTQWARDFEDGTTG